MFKQTYLKLTGIYLAIIMVISLFFSGNIYVLSTQELRRGLYAQGQGLALPGELGLPQSIRDQIQAERQQQYNIARGHVVNRLILINLVILASGGVVSYYLARRTLRPIEEAHEAQSRFTADASHELRTPIAVMQSEIEVALMKPKLSLAQAKQLLHSNLEELAKLTNLSEGLLRLAQLENHDLERRSVAVGTVVDHAVARSLPQAEKKNILIHAKTGKGSLVGDEASLSEALVILLDNAIKYSPEKSQIQVTTAKSQRTVEIKVQDHGVGIKATELPHIFDRFYRADSARSRQNTHGYGIGLAIAKNIVELHGGRLTAKSKPGKGSTFTMALPAKTALREKA